MCARPKKRSKNRLGPKTSTRQATSLASAQEQKRFLALYNTPDVTEAHDYALTLTRRYPEDAFSWKVLGSCLHKQREFEASLAALDKSLAIKNDDAQTQQLLARAWYDLGEPEKAIGYARRAIELEPDFAQGHFSLAQILTESDKDTEALDHIERAEMLGYNSVVCLTVKGHILTKRRRYKKAFEVTQELVEKSPDNASAHNDLANVYKDLGQFEQAETSYRTALRLQPDDDTALCNIVVCKHYDPAASATQISKTITELHGCEARQTAPYTYDIDTHAANKVIRIGLVSPGFRNHPVGQMILAGLAELDAGFELHFYSTNNSDDHITQRLKQIATRWNLVRQLDQDALAEQIHADRIDILFDLAGFGEGQRLQSMRRKPAPLIVKWVGGLINTMGVSAYDYLLSDNYETPEGADDWYTEKLIRMPDDYICYAPPLYAPPITALPAISNGYITLGCFNNPAKINPVLLEEWAKLMHELPNSRLFLKSGQYESPDYCERLRAVMAEHGIKENRIILEGPSNHDDLMAAYNRVDIALDTWPYSGGLTTCEAFMMGVPVVTLPGPTFAGRHSATHLINAGMPELVTFTWEEYRQKVVELASDITNLSVIRACLRRFLTQSPVCDAEKFGKNFSRAMRAIWQRHCEGKAPAALTLDQKGQAFFEDSAEPVEIKKSQPALEQNGFRWDFEGKIIAVDNGGQLLDNPTIKSLVDQDLLEIIVFDPAGSAADNSMSQYEGVHYFAHNGLGDGKPGTLNICSDPAMTSLLEPLSDEQSGNGNTTNEVVSREPFNTVTLNSLDGLPSLDWLVLDDLSDSAAILDNGGEALKDTLLIQIKVAFQPTHERQPNLAEVQHWASRNGFRFYRLHAPEHRSLMPTDVDISTRQATELVTANAIFLPVSAKMQDLTKSQKKKLAFILHNIYGTQDMSYKILNLIDSESSISYLKSLSKIYSAREDAKAADLPNEPHMSRDEKALFSRALDDAKNYFEFGSGGSTVWAVQKGLRTYGVESDKHWVETLKRELGESCQIEFIDIGPTGDWGYPTSNIGENSYSMYFSSIEQYNSELEFDLILVDGRFRVACAASAALHIMSGKSNTERKKIFIHDFWNRPNYHKILEFLEPLESADSASLFRVKNDTDRAKIKKIRSEFSSKAE